ncbi:MAG: hypothetical protein JWQ42_3750 [Edaphobacter sp.]|nr:hypothetical protein [Edaphobacter sp.]
MSKFSKNIYGVHGSTFFRGSWLDIENSTRLVGVVAPKGETR